MKILFLFPHFLVPGGAANVTIKFARGLQSKGYQVKILCANASSDFLKENSDLKISQLHIPTSNSFFYWALFPYWQYKINIALAKYKDYIFFPQVLPSNWWAWIYKLSHKKQKIIWYCHEPSAFIHSKKWINAIQNPIMRVGAKILNPILKKIDIALEKQNDIVVCNSQFTAKEYERCYNRKAMGIVYPPIDTISIKPEKKKEKYFFTVSRLSKFKNVKILIEAFAKFSTLYSNYRLIIAGEGEDKNNLQEIARAKKITNKISFLGRISEQKKEEFYKKALVTILCSHNEPFGLVPIESMMYGTPVIAHNSGGPKETIINGKNGFLFKDVNDLADKMQKINSLDKEEYLTMQKKCRKESLEYSLSNSINQLENILLKK